MGGIDELSRVIGNLERGIHDLAKRQEEFCERLSRVEELLERRAQKDARASFEGGIIGGFVAIIAILIGKLVKFFWGG